jgi:hypothetical protein
MTAWHLAQINVARLNTSLDDTSNAEFVAALEPMNALAEASPGFVWRLVDEDGASSSYVPIPGNDDPLVIVNYSIWEDVESLRHYVTKSGHVAYLRRRQEWFERSEQPTTACWWVPAGRIPPLSAAWDRLEQLRRDGPSGMVFPLNRPFPPPH